MIYSLSAPISLEWKSGPFICSRLIEDGGLLLNASSPQFLPEAPLDWAYLSSSLSVENALFDLYVHMILFTVKNSPYMQHQGKRSCAWEIVTRNTVCFADTELISTGGLCETDECNVFSVVRPHFSTDIETHIISCWKKNTHIAVVSVTWKRAYYSDLHLDAVSQGRARISAQHHNSITSKFICNMDTVQDVLYCINFNFTPPNLVKVPYVLQLSSWFS